MKKISASLASLIAIVALFAVNASAQADDESGFLGVTRNLSGCGRVVTSGDKIDQVEVRVQNYTNTGRRVTVRAWDGQGVIDNVNVGVQSYYDRDIRIVFANRGYVKYGVWRGDEPFLASRLILSADIGFCPTTNTGAPQPPF
jgi:hypothetical protein